MADPERFDAQTDPTFQADADPDQDIPRGVNLPGGMRPWGVTHDLVESTTIS